MASTQEIVDQLNAFEATQTGADIWQDVIMRLDEYDEAATKDLDPSTANNVIGLSGGDVIRWDPQTKSWHAEI